jgi:hypothetical protein
MDQYQKSMNMLITPLTTLSNSLPTLGQTIKQANFVKDSNWDKLVQTMGAGPAMLKGAYLGGREGFTSQIEKNPNVSMKTALGGGFQGAMKGAGTALKSAIMPAVGAMASLGPQMAFMAIVMAPIQAFLEGILEPLEPLNELMGAFGQILGTALIPTVQIMLEHLMPLIPGLMGVADAISPVVTWLFKFTTPLGLIFTIVDAITSISWPDVGKWFTDLPGKIGQGFINLVVSITQMFDTFIRGIIEGISHMIFLAGVELTKMVNNIVGFNTGGADTNLFTPNV